jgi:tetratricopeptide (TPR) repeat protein
VSGTFAARACTLRETIDRIQTRTPSGETVRTTQALAEQLHLEGIDLYRKGEIEKALHAYEKAQALCPDFPALLNSHGFALQDMDRMEEARACFERAVALAPEMDMARLNLAMAQLKMGDWEAGWENYEARWTGSAEAHAGTLQRPAYPLPLWNGEEATENQRLLVITEQGFGDTFQFSRYLPLVAKRFAQVGFVCSQPTQRLMEWAFGDGEQGIITFTRLPSDMTEWDVYCPLMSLPRAFKTRPETIPAAQPPLRVPPTVSQYWRQRLERAAPGRYRVGIAWAGRKAHQYDGRRSLRFEQILPWLEDPRITWVSLQKWAPDELRPAVPDSVDWIDWTEELTDFADSAGLLSGLDLLISIDSALVHLAGGLGFPPVWMLNRFDMEWRWFRHREDSPWYPQLRIFNQPAFGDWASVLARVHAELKALPLPDVPRAPRLSKPETLPAIRAMSKDWPLAHQWHEQGIAAWQAGKRDEAVAFLEKAIGHDGHVALFHSNLGEMKRQLGRVDEAIAHGRAAVTLAPDQAGAHSNLGIALYDAGALDEAQACHEKALDLSPRLLQSINNLGSIERARGHRKAAIRHYRRALEMDPRFVESLSNLGAVLLEDDQPEAAEGPLLQAISIQGEYPEALCTLGLVRMKQGQIAQAIGLLERALVLRPAYPEARAALFALQTRTGELSA